MDHDVVGGICFLATMDDVTDLNLSSGEGWISTAKSYHDLATRNQIQTNNWRSDAKIAKGKGRLGDALHFGSTSKRVLFYKAEEFHNGMRDVVADWTVTMSVWVRMPKDAGDRAAEINRHAILFQLTQAASTGPTLTVEHVRQGDDPSVEPTNELRLVLTKQPRDLGDNDDGARTLVRVKRSPLTDGHWHHLVLSIGHENVNANEKNNGQSSGIATLYLDGRRLGRCGMDLPMPFDRTKGSLVLGHGFVGYLDHLWMTQDVLSDQEVRRTYERPELFR
ncbi:MAG: hypothetical protein WBD20_13240 [Pirellulaceae bacterium]